MLYWPVTESAVSHLSLAPSSSLSAVLGGGHLGTSCQKPWNSIFWRNKAKAVLCLCLCVNLTEGFSNKRGEVFSAAETSSGLGSGGDAALSWLITGAIELWNVLLGLSRSLWIKRFIRNQRTSKGFGFLSQQNCLGPSKAAFASGKVVLLLDGKVDRRVYSFVLCGRRPLSTPPPPQPLPL